MADPTARVLIVDDEPANIAILSRLMTQQGHEVLTAPNGEIAVDTVTRERPDLVLLDVNMPGIDGFEVCRRIKNDWNTRFIPVVLVTALSATEDRTRGADAGADDFLSKPFDVQELRARVKSAIRLKRHTDELESVDSVIMSLALTIEARDAYTDGHCQRLARYSTALGTRLNLTRDELEALDRGGFLHDLGKIGIPDRVLLKNTGLTPDEYELMKQHTVIGDRLCGSLRSLRLVRPIVRHHHERLDGSGYPDGLKGDAIPLLAQIVSIADAYDAITTERPYRAAAPPERAFAELSSDVRKGWRNAQLVDEFIALGRAGELRKIPPTSPGG
jgi:putative two-component system response regulator